MIGGRILLVEDEFIIAEVIKDTLESAGVRECVHVASVDEGVQAAGAGNWNGAFLDIRLNGVFVFPVAEQLSVRGVPFAFCTGDGDSAIIPKKFASAPILSKPWGPGAIERLAADLFSTS